MSRFQIASKPVPQGVVSWENVRDYGAAGDGSADDTTAFQAALDAAAASGVPVFVPAGTYRITGGLTVDGGVEVRGDGRPYQTSATQWARAVIDASGLDENTTLFTVQGPSAETDVVGFRRLAILGNDTSGTGNIFDVSDLRMFSLVNVVVRESPNRILNFTSGVTRCELVDSLLEGSKNGTVLHVGVDGTDAALNHLDVDGCDLSGGAPNCVRFDVSSATGVVGALELTDSNFVTADQEVLYLDEKGDCTATGCVFENGSEDDADHPLVYVGAGSLYRFENCYFAGPGPTGGAAKSPMALHLDGAARCHVVGCYFDITGADPNASAVVVVISGGSESVFAANTVNTGGIHGLLLEDSGHASASTTAPEAWSIVSNEIGAGFCIWIDGYTGDHNAIVGNVLNSFNQYMAGQGNLGADDLVIGNTTRVSGGAPVNPPPTSLPSGHSFGIFGVTPVAQQGPLTGEDASAVNSGDATTDAVIDNIRTRLGELEAAFQNFGHLA